MISYLKALYQFVQIRIADEYLFLIILCTAIISGIFLVAREQSTAEDYHRYVWKDLLTLSMCHVNGCVLNLLDQQGTQEGENALLLFLWIIVLLTFSAAEVSVLKRIGGIVLSVLSVAAVVLLCRYAAFLEIRWLYFAVRILTHFVNAAVLCDVILYISLRKKDARRKDEKALRHRALCRYTFQQLVVFLAAAVLFVLPGNLNYVNTASAYAYGDEIRYLSEKAADDDEKTEIPEEPVEEPEQEPVIRIPRTEMLGTLEEHTYPFDPGVLDAYDSDTLNSHRLTMVFVGESEYQNPLLQETVLLTAAHQINPSYLFVQLMGYDAGKSAGFSIETPEEIPQLGLPERQEMTETEYGECVMNRIAAQLSFAPEHLYATMQAGCYYTYFAVCDESAVYDVTLYLHFDASGELTGADYSVLQFVDFNTDAEVIECPDYISEIETAYAAVFGDTMTRDFRGYDTLLERDGNLMLLRRYNNSYS